MAGYPARVLIGIAITVVLGVIAAFQSYSLLTDYSRTNPDTYKIEQQIERYAGVREMLPPETVLGFISDVPFGDEGGSADFFGAQYALAPLLLVEESDRRKQEWVVSSFVKRPDVEEIERTRGLKLVRNFGKGVRLFRRAR
jgi:hypothetical protein